MKVGWWYNTLNFGLAIREPGFSLHLGTNSLNNHGEISQTSLDPNFLHYENEVTGLGSL